jgi:replicative DNA helicase
MILAGRLGSEKPVLGLQIAAHAAIDHDKTALFVWLEMSRQDVNERLLASGAELDAKRTATGWIANDSCKHRTRWHLRRCLLTTSLGARLPRYWHTLDASVDGRTSGWL